MIDFKTSIGGLQRIEIDGLGAGVQMLVQSERDISSIHWRMITCRARTVFEFNWSN
jgi:hypothetical protein